MSKYRAAYGRPARMAALFVLIFAGSATVAVAGSGVAPLVPASAGAACSRADARTLAAPWENSCKGTPTSDNGGSYTYQTLDYPGASQTIFWGVNDFGEMAGQYTSGGAPAHAMIYRHGRFEPLDPDALGTYFSAAGGPTDIGTTFGAYADASGLQHGFVMHGAHLQKVDVPGHLNSNVDGVSLFGGTLLVYWDADGAFHGMLRRHGNDTPIEVAGARDTYPLSINGKGEVVGYWDSNPLLRRGFYRAVNGQISNIDVPGATSTATFAINDRGQIAGYYTTASGALHGFVKTRAQFQDVDVPGAAATIATSVNNFGVVTGEYYDALGGIHGFIATPGLTMHR